MNSEQLHQRQICLNEVGESGQERIAQEDCAVTDYRGAEIEMIYLHRAGVQRLSWVLADRETTEFPYADTFLAAEAREFAAGAWGALQQLRRALGVGAR